MEEGMIGHMEMEERQVEEEERRGEEEIERKKRRGEGHGERRERNMETD
jgi:hypothetical protein